MIYGSRNSRRISTCVAFAPLLICCGGMAHLGDLLGTGWDKTEAEMFAEAAERRGVPREKTLSGAPLRQHLR